jgi:hypothetical protein
MIFLMVVAFCCLLVGLLMETGALRPGLLFYGLSHFHQFWYWLGE